MFKAILAIFLMFLSQNAFSQADYTSEIEVKQNGTSQGYAQTANCTTGLTCTSSSGVWTISASGGSGNVGIGTSGNPAYYASNGSTVSAFTGVNYVGSNVGIGSSVPGQRLDVQGTIRATYFVGDGSLLTGISSPWTRASTNIYPTTITDNVGIGTTLPSSLFEVGTQKFNVLSGGNVGVANNNPQFKLSVAGTGYFSGALTLGSSIDLIINGQTWSGASNPSTPPTSWSIVFFGTGSITNNNPLLLFSIGTNDIYIYQAVPTVIGTSYTVKSTWSGVGGSFNGILRVGTSANDNTLGQSALGNGVNGTNSVSFAATGTITYVTCYAGNVGNGSLSNVNMFASSVNGSVLQAYGGVSIGTSFASINPPMSGVIIQGNVGINTTNPGQPLEVSGSIRSTGTNTHIFGSDNTAWIGSSAASSGALTFNTASAEKMRISNGGNVGIGTVNPSSLFNVGGNIYLDRSTSQIVMKDATGGTCTKITTQSGVINGAVTSCP